MNTNQKQGKSNQENPKHDTADAVVMSRVYHTLAIARPYDANCVGQAITGKQLRRVYIVRSRIKVEMQRNELQRYMLTLINWVTTNIDIGE